MALQIKELSVKVKVNADERYTKPTGKDKPHDTDYYQLVDDCVKRVLEELKFTKGR